MAYKCLDCSYTAKAKFPAGKCPACDSFNVRGAKSKAGPVSKERKTIGDIVFAVLLWGVLIWGFWDQYL